MKNLLITIFFLIGLRCFAEPKLIIKGAEGKNFIVLDGVSTTEDIDLSDKVNINGSNSVFNVANWAFTNGGTNYIKTLSVDTNGRFIAATTEQ